MKETAYQATRQPLVSFSEKSRIAYNFDNYEDIKQVFEGQRRPKHFRLCNQSRREWQQNHVCHKKNLFQKITVKFCICNNFKNKTYFVQSTKNKPSVNTIEDNKEAAQYAAEGFPENTPIPQSQMKAALKQMFTEELKSKDKKLQKNLWWIPRIRSQTLQTRVKWKKKNKENQQDTIKQLVLI